MKRRGRIIAALTALAALVGAWAVYSASAAPETWPRWLSRVAVRYSDRALATGLIVTAVTVLLQGIQAWLGPAGFRYQTIQSTLDIIVSECAGTPKKNRVTLFRKVPGWKALFIGLARLRWRYWRVEKKTKLLALFRIELFADYLYVYARSSTARAQSSSATFRVSDRPDECEGMAGYAWEKTFFVRPNLPRLSSHHRLAIQQETIDQIKARHSADNLRKYVELSRINSTEQLRAIETFARHFVGHIIRTDEGDWGVLLLDSEEAACPFSADEDDAGTFGRVFQTQAEVLGNMLRGA